MENPGYEARVAQAYARMAHRDVSRPVFHLTPLSGTLADPNGLVQVGDTYHVMHINNPLGCEVEGRTPCVWAHWTTRDFVHWRREPVAVWPDSARDRDGVYSGSALVRDGRMHLLYTGNVRHHGDFDYVTSGREQNVMRVSSEDADMTRFGEKNLLMTNDDFPATMTQHVRDPQVVERDGATYLLLGARTREDVGCVLVYRADDLEHCSLAAGTRLELRLREDCEFTWRAGELVLRMGPTCGAGRDERRMFVPELTRLQVFVDDTTLEVFVNDGWATLTSRLFGAGDECRVDALVGTGTFWPMSGFTLEG